MAGKRSTAIAGHDWHPDHPMIHLSVAIGRFVEALFWGIFRVAGGVALLVLGAAIVIIAVLAVGSSLCRQRRD